MNIFFTDRDPKVIARDAVDSHVSKMILECAELLSAARKDGIGVRYPKSVPNHPCTLWVAESRAHYAFVLNLMWAYLDEFKYRRHKDHAYRYKNEVIDLFTTPRNIPDGVWLRDPPLAMDDKYKDVDHVKAYRRYIKHGKWHLHKWSGSRKQPDWFAEV